MRQLLRRARIFDGEIFHDEKSLSLIDDQIDTIQDATVNPADWDEVHDLDGLILCPGFIDVQVNGGGGVMINGQTDLEGLKAMAEAHRAYGTTTMLPTLISDELSAMRHVAALTKEALALSVEEKRDTSIGSVKGVHFEGPYLNPERKGVHKKEILRGVDEEALALYSDPSLGIRLVTVAPEIAGVDFISALNQRNVLTCAGHSAASFDEITNALKSGLRGFTHLFNAMTPLNSREPGVVGAAIHDDDSWCGLIVDGFHVHPAALQVAIKAKPKGKMMLVSDAMASVGASDKSFDLYGQTIIAKNGKCQTEDGTLAGSDLDMITAVRNSVEMLHLPLSEALRMASLYPAQFMKQDSSLGSIRPGLMADLIAFDTQSWSVAHSWIGGEHQKHPA